eukprot:g59485.t1
MAAISHRVVHGILSIANFTACGITSVSKLYPNPISFCIGVPLLATRKPICHTSLFEVPKAAVRQPQNQVNLAKSLYYRGLSTG